MSNCPHCGGSLKGGKPRSIDQHRRYFKMVALAFQNWPEAHDFQPDNAEHLRKWLQAKAGYRIAHKIDTERTDARSLAIATAAMKAAMQALGDYCWIVPHRGSLLVVASKSIAFDKMSLGEFSTLNDMVAELIESETGIKVEDLMKETVAA
jgi:hypothetical protein